MTNNHSTASMIRRTLLVSTVAALLSTSALAGQCPAGKVVADGKGQKPGATANAKVKDTVIGSIDLTNEAPKLAGRKFRLRRLVIQPGGTVAWHSHGDRPAIIYIVSGTIVEYRSTCTVPIVHRAGDVAEEMHTTSHWWKNRSKRNVVLLSADILNDGANARQM